MAAKNNFFKQNLDKYGDGFINIITPDQIQNQAKRIVKELIKGEIELEIYGQYFLDLKFLDNFILGVTSEYDESSLYLAAVSLYRSTYPQTPNISLREYKLQCLCYIYGVILNKLQQVKQTQNIGSLVDISALLYNYKNQLK